MGQDWYEQVKKNDQDAASNEAPQGGLQALLGEDKTHKSQGG